MNTAPSLTVIDKEGVRGTLDAGWRPEASDTPQVIVRLSGDREVWVPRDLLRPHEDGTYSLPLRFADFEPTAGSSGDQVVIPVIEEHALLGRREVEAGRVRITKTVDERDHLLDEPLLRDEVTVERVPINQLADGPVGVRQEGDTTVIPVLEEVLVVQRRILVREELRVTKRRAEYRAPQHVSLLREDVTVERMDARPTTDVSEEPGA